MQPMTTASKRQPEVCRHERVDPRQRVRTVPMEVLSLGYSRTGTMTMSAAFEILGIPSWHWVKMAENTPDIAMWIEVLASKFAPKDPKRMSLNREIFDNLLGHVGACTDQPAAIVAEELVAAYPEAKVVLVERDVDRWFESYRKTVIAGTSNPMIPFLTRIDPDFIGNQARLTDMIAEHYFRVTAKRESWLFNNPDFFEEWLQKAKAGYLAHNAEVKRVTPPERLLIYRLEDGWEPLCNFLSKPVPDTPFPKVNDTAELNKLVASYLAEGLRRGVLRMAKKVAPVAVLILAIIAWCLLR